jgi:hypothetical protein
MPSKKWRIFVGILLFFIILNPGMDRFKEYTGLIGKNGHYLTRKYNFLIYSIYEDSLNEKKYIGFLLNFFDITSKKQLETTNASRTTSDSTEVLEKPNAEVDEYGVPIKKK